MWFHNRTVERILSRGAWGRGAWDRNVVLESYDIEYCAVIQEFAKRFNVKKEGPWMVSTQEDFTVIMLTCPEAVTDAADCD